MVVWEKDGMAQNTPRRLRDELDGEGEDGKRTSLAPRSDEVVPKAALKDTVPYNSSPWRFHV